MSNLYYVLLWTTCSISKSWFNLERADIHYPESHLIIFVFIQPLDYESRRLYTLKVEAENTHVDPRFYYLGPFKDTTIVKISIEDVDEPPVFSRSSYLFEVHEDIEVGTIIGTVMARDPDSSSSPIRYSCQCYRLKETE